MDVIITDQVEGLMVHETIHHCFSRAVLAKKVNKVLQNMSDDTTRFELLLRSYPSRLLAVLVVHGGNSLLTFVCINLQIKSLKNNTNFIYIPVLV